MNKRRVGRIGLYAVMALLVLGTIVVLADAPTGYLLVPDHHEGVLGDNNIEVTATELEADYRYRIKLDVSYHPSPYNPPDPGETAPTGYTESVEFDSDGTDFTHIFTVNLPDCHWQIHAGFTLYYWNGANWAWNGDERATEGVDIWADCEEPPPPPPPPPSQPGTGTPGYWKNHPDAWPVDTITIGGIAYSKSGAIEYLNMPEKGDKTFTMFRALVAAKLNVEIGNEDDCIADTISAADAWMAMHGPVGSGVKGGGKDSPWRDGEGLYETLDAYNNGKLCAPSRD